MPKPPLRLRAAGPDDDPAIAALWRASALTIGVEGEPPDEPWFVDRLVTGRAEGWVVSLVERDGRMAGFVAFQPPEASLRQLFVAPDEQGRGVGRLLLAFAKAAMPEGFGLRTNTGNMRARAFYEASGFELEREGPHPVYGDPTCWYRWSGRD